MPSFDTEPQLDEVEPELAPIEPAFPDFEGLGSNGLLDDTSLGGGDPDAILDALGHYAEDAGPLPDMTMPAVFAGPEPATAAPSAPAQTPAPKPAAPKPAAPKPAASKPNPSKAASAKPKRAQYDWDKVRQATDDPSDPYDIRWISKLPAPVRASIDGAYADNKLDARVANATTRDRDLKKLKAQKKTAVAASRKAAAKQMGISDKSVFLDPPSSPFVDREMRSRHEASISSARTSAISATRWASPWTSTPWQTPT